MSEDAEYHDPSPYDARLVLDDPTHWAHYGIRRIVVYGHGGERLAGIGLDDRLLAVEGRPLKPGCRARSWDSEDCPNVVALRDWRESIVTDRAPEPTLPPSTHELAVELWRRLRASYQLRGIGWLLGLAMLTAWVLTGGEP